MKTNSLLAIGNYKSNITQVNVNGLSKDDVQKLCLRLINEQMVSLREDAAKVFKSQIDEFVELLYQRLAEISESYDVLNRMKTPAVQFALDESLLIYAKHPSMEEKELQVELLIDKIQTDDNTTKGIIIDAARIELCNLTNAQVSLLAFLVICGLKNDNEDKDGLFAFFQKLGMLLNDILQMKKVDYAYLQNTNCLHRISFIDKAEFIEKTLFDSYGESTGQSKEEDLKCYLNTAHPLWSTILDRVKNNNMACYKPTAVGFYIGLKRLEKVLGMDLDFDVLYN